MINGRKKTRNLRWRPEDVHSFPFTALRKVVGGSHNPHQTVLVLPVIDRGEPDRRTELWIKPEDIAYLIAKLQFIADRIEA